MQHCEIQQQSVPQIVNKTKKKQKKKQGNNFNRAYFTVTATTIL